MIKRLLKVLLGLVLGVVLLVGALFIPGVANLLGLSGFVTQQVERLADDFLNPRLTIGSITYVFPRGAILYDVTLTQDDTTILHIKRAKIALERLPISSQQVRFSGFYLEDPVLRLQVDDQGDLIGWSDFVKEEPGDASDRADRASDHFAVDRIVMTNATIEYADQRVESGAMKIDGFNLDVEAKPSTAKAGAAEVAAAPKGSVKPSPENPPIPTGAGWYRLSTTIDRAPIVTIDLDMAMSIDTLDLVFKQATMNTTMTKENYQVLPPQLQEFVTEHSITGDLSVHTTGYLDIDDPLEGPLLINVSLTNGAITGDGNQLEVKSLGGSGRMSDDELVFEDIQGSILKGGVYADFLLRLADGAVPAGTRRPETDADAARPPATNPGGADSGPTDTQRARRDNRAFSIISGLQLKDLDLATLTRNRPARNRLVGKLTLDVEAVGNVARWPKTLRGDGELQVRDARLTGLGLVSGLSSAMRVVTLQRQHQDRMVANFDLTPTGVELSHFNLVTSTMAVRGAGVIGFDGSLNLILNGGPLERIQESLGAVGHALGRVTDRLVRYQVQGTTEDPVVHVRPFGLFTGDPMAEAKAARQRDREAREARKEQAAQDAPTTGTPDPAPSDATGSDSGG